MHTFGMLSCTSIFLCHGLTFDTVGPIAAFPEVMELNIGHFLIGEAIFSGLDSAIRRMRSLMNQARKQNGSQSA